ncbi:MAG TPA: chitobiase/beta-hexosaminidase C-terminal domain-containing protein [Kofleriaceae bacterium]
MKRSGAYAIVVVVMWRSCLVPVLVIVTGCHLAFPIEPDSDAGAGAPPRVFSSPGPAATLYGGYPKSFAITLAADQPGTTIYYTTDGTPPDVDSTSTSSAATPIRGITISANSMVKYFGIYQGASSTPVTEDFSIDATTAQTNAGYLVTSVTLDGTSPVVIAAPGATLAARANIQTWVQTSCPSCAAQVVFGVNDTDQGCIFEGNPNVYPGVTMTGKAFNVRAPMTPGVHEVKVAHIEQTSCAQAMASMALKTRPTLARIGIIVVR